MPLIVSCIKCLFCLDYANENMQKYNQLYQLRHDLSHAESVELKNGSLQYWADQSYQIYLVNEKVIRTPGTVIYFVNVEDCFFYQLGNQLWMVLKQNGKEEEWMIGYVR